MPHFIRTRLFEKAPFFVLIDRTTGGAKLKKASNIKGFRIKDNSVRLEGCPPCSPVLQEIISFSNPEPVPFGAGSFFARGAMPSSRHSRAPARPWPCGERRSSGMSELSALRTGARDMKLATTKGCPSRSFSFQEIISFSNSEPVPFGAGSFFAGTKRITTAVLLPRSDRRSSTVQQKLYKKTT